MANGFGQSGMLPNVGGGTQGAIDDFRYRTLPWIQNLLGDVWGGAKRRIPFVPGSDPLYYLPRDLSRAVDALGREGQGWREDQYGRLVHESTDPFLNPDPRMPVGVAEGLGTVDFIDTSGFGIEIDPNTGMPVGVAERLGTVDPQRRVAAPPSSVAEEVVPTLEEIVIDQQRRVAAPTSPVAQTDTSPVAQTDTSPVAQTAPPPVARFDLGEQDPNFVGPGSSLMNQVPDGAGPQSWQERLFGFGGGDPGMNMMMTGLRMLGNASRGQGFGQSLADAYTAQTGDARQLEAQSYARNQAKLDRELAESEFAFNKEYQEKRLTADVEAAKRQAELDAERNEIARQRVAQEGFRELAYQDLRRIDNELQRYPDPNSAEHKRLLAEREQIISRINALKTSGLGLDYASIIPGGGGSYDQDKRDILDAVNRSNL